MLGGWGGEVIPIAALRQLLRDGLNYDVFTPDPIRRLEIAERVPHSASQRNNDPYISTDLR